MATRTPGSGGTNQSTTLEGGLIADLRRLQSFERNTAKNPSGFNYVNSTSSDDDATFTASITFPISITINNGAIAIVPVDYLSLTSADYAPGTGGTIKSNTIQGAIIEQTILMSNLEKQTANNPTGSLLINYSTNSTTLSGLGNATFTASYSTLPLEITENSNGEQVTKGKAYLIS